MLTREFESRSCGGVFDTTLCDKVCQLLAVRRWLSLDTPFSYTNKSDCHDITEILLKVALNTISPGEHTKVSIVYFQFATDEVLDMVWIPLISPCFCVCLKAMTQISFWHSYFYVKKFQVWRRNDPYYFNWRYCHMLLLIFKPFPLHTFYNTFRPHIQEQRVNFLWILLFAVNLFRCPVTCSLNLYYQSINKFILCQNIFLETELDTTERNKNT